MNLSRRTYIFAAIVFPVVLLAVYSYLNIRNQTKERLYEERSALASLSAGILNEKLERINDLALSFSTRVLLSQLVEQQKWDGAIERVKNIPEDFDYIDRVFITDTTGTLMADAPFTLALRNINYAQFDWYIGFMKSQQPYLSPVYKRTVPPYSMVSAFAMPIKNTEGKVRGILVLQVNMDKLLLWGKSVKVGSNGFLYVVDQQGHIAIHPSYANTDSIVDYSPVPEVQKALKGEKNVEILYHTIEKENRLTAYERVPGYGWAVMVTQEAKEAFAAGSNLNITVVMYAFIILFACFLAYFITREMDLRKKSEESLKVSEEKFRSLMNLVPVGITLSAVDGKILEANQTILDMMGFATKEEFINTSASGVFFDKNERAKMVESFIKNGILKNFETLLKRQNGELLWISGHVIPFKIPGGETVLLSASIDITHRKKVEEQLKEYQHFFNHSNDLCLIANMQGYFETVNPTVEKVLGYSEKEWMEKPFIEFVHPEDIDAVVIEYGKQKTEAASVMNFICRFLKKDGSYVWLEWNSIPNPVTGKIYAVGRDITERKKAEEQLLAANKELESYILQLKESEEQIETIFTNAPDAVIVIDDEGKIVRWNPRAEAIFGWTADEVIDKHLHEIIIPERFREAHQKGMKHFLKTKEGPILNKPLELPAIRKDYSEFDAGISISPTVLNEKYYFIGFVSDISYRKKAEEQLQAVNKELEAFSYSVSHDLRAPLRAVNGYAKILQEDYAEKIDEDGISALQSIMNNSKKMGVLIDDLLAFSRLGRKEIATSEINMHTLVRSVRDEVLNGEEKETEFKIEQLPPAFGDQSLIRQVWVNLISNAIKYSQRNPRPLIEIGAHSNGSTVEYYVKDNGAGFDMQYYDKLFGVFQRLHSQEEFEGTGIGLAIVQKIISRHNGTIRAEAKINEGACFYFTLPAIK